MAEEVLIHYDSCPSCGSTDLQTALSATDYTVSHKQFEILSCDNCQLRFTQGVPDPSSIGRYYRSDDYISHTDTNKGLVNSLYHMVRKHTLGNKYRLIQSATRLKKGALLDIGAGTGAFAAHMKDNGWTVTGLEPDEDTRKRALALNQIQLLPVEKLFALPSESFDIITLWHVLEHVHDLHSYMDQLKRLIKRKGTIFIAVPNYMSFDARVYKGAWAAYDVPRHLYHFSSTSMEQLLESHDLQLLGSRPMWYDSFYISMLSEKYKTGKGNLVKAFLTGALSNLKAFVDKAKCSSLIYVVGK